MRQVVHRLCIGISGLGIFWLLGLISANELEAGRSSWVVESRGEYDNAVAYSDFVVASLIKEAMAAGGNNASVIYSSDHAQEVGHTRNHTGQSLSDRSGYEIPLLVWTRGESNNKNSSDLNLQTDPIKLIIWTILLPACSRSDRSTT